MRMGSMPLNCTGSANEAARNRALSSNGVRKPQRRVYDAAFKLMVVEEALKLPADNRIKPTCRLYPGIEPVRRARASRTARRDAFPVPHRRRRPGYMSRPH